jgi:hypothetical protein
MTNQINRWMLIPPGGPSGPFWGVMAQNGNMKALRMVDQTTAEFLVLAGNVAQCDFDLVHNAGIRLREILERDFPDNSPDEMPITPGDEDYVIRSVLEAIFGVRNG